jgi:signal transduction histidine kinase
MTKFRGCFSTIVLCCIIAGIYGILIDQLTYTVSPEYYTHYKFPLYTINPYEFGGDRMSALVIGFLATWWTGLFIGAGLGFTSMIFEQRRERRKNLVVAVLIVLVTTILLGVIGYFYGLVVEVNDVVDQRMLIQSLNDPVEFIIVRSVHQHSYVGAFLGLFLGISYLFTQKAKTNLLQAKFAV